MKKIIYILGTLFLAIIIILNVIYTTVLDSSENALIHVNSYIYIIGIILMIAVISGVNKLINMILNKNIESKSIDNKEKQRMKKKIFIIVLVIYIVFNIIWAILVNPKVIGDSVHVCNFAQTISRGDSEEFLNNITYAGITLKEYMQAYPQQITLSFVYSIFFRIIHFDIMEVLRVLNVIGNIAIVIALYKICKHLSKNYSVNKIRLLTLILTFISLPMLLTFVYGDIPSIALCLFAIYFMMKYTESQKIKYPIFAAIFTMIAYMMRMNSLIFIIATVMYLLFYFFKDIKTKTTKENLLNILIIAVYISISIMPASFVKSYYIKKYDMDEAKEYPTISFLLIAMEEAPRGNGWYNERIGEYALNNVEKAEKEYKEKIKKRLKYFSENIGYTAGFYTKKLASMWTENTYSAVISNIIKNDQKIDNITNVLTFYQKALLLVTCIYAIVVLIQNRNNLSPELIFLLTIFVGGFMFHILWEAKSRYVIPYILVLMPISSIAINKLPKNE